MVRFRRLIALVVVVALLAVAMAPMAGTSFTAVLVPLGPLFGAVVSAPLEPTEIGHPHSLFVLASLPFRAPPTA